MPESKKEYKKKSNKKQDVLVTGGNGVIGKPLVEELKKRGHSVWVVEPYHTHLPQFIKCNVKYYQDVERVFKFHKFDYVFHLAAEFGRKNGEEYYQSLWETNAVGMRHMLAMQEQYGFRMIFPSSSEIYGKNFSGIMKEDVSMKYEIRLGNDYALSKWVNEQQILNSIERAGTETVRWRFSNVYGPGEYYTDYRSVICLFIYRALHNMSYTVYTGSKRAFLYIDDAVRTVANIMDDFKSGEVYNISNLDLYSMQQVSDAILKILGKDDRLVTYIKEDVTATKVKELDNSKAIRELGHKQTISFEEGLKRTVNWYKQVYGIEE